MKTFPKRLIASRTRRARAVCNPLRGFLFALLAFVFWCVPGLALRAADSATTLPPAPSLTNRITVAVLGFENKSGDASNAFWRFTVEDMLGDELSEVKRLRILPSVGYALRQIHKKRGDAISTVDAAEAGKSINAHRVIWGSYDRKNGKWVLTAHILKPANTKISADLNAASADWFEVRDQIVKKILGELAVSPTAAERNKMYRRETSSPAAFECLARAIALHREKGRLSEAERLIRQAIASDTNYGKAQFDLAAALSNQGDMESAGKAMRQAMQLLPDSSQTHLGVGVLLMLGEGFERAEPELLAAARLDPDNEESWERLGELYKVRGALDLSVENFNRALRLDPWSANIHAQLGGIHALQGLPDQALAELKQAEPLADPNDMDDQQSLAQAFDALHEIPSAITHYESLLLAGRKEGANPKILGQISERLKDLKETLTPVYVSAPHPRDYDAAALSKIFHEKLSATELTLVTNPLTSTPEMDHWARDIVAGATNDLEKAQRLFTTLSRHVDEGSQGRRTAQQTFAVWRTPDASLVCQEYAFLYVALSRAVGLKTYQVFVEQACDGRTVLHACAALFIGDKVLLVDPMFRWFGVPHKKFTVQDDLQTVAVYLATRGDAQSAQIAVKLEPDWDFIRLSAANELINANQLDAARKITPAEALAHAQGWLADVVRAAFAGSEGRDNDAIGFLKKVIVENADYGDAYAALGFYCVKEKQWAEARTNYSLALEHCWETKKANAYRAALIEIDETLGPDPTNSSGPIDAQDYINRGDARGSRAEYDKANADYTKAIELKPKFAEAFLHRGHSLILQEKTNEAVADFREALRLDPQAAEGYEYLGYIYENGNDNEKAVQNYQKAIQLGTHRPPVYARLAWILLTGPESLQNHQQGLELARKACILSDWKESQMIVQLVYADLLQNDNNSALSHAKLALSLPDITKDNEKYLQGVIDDSEKEKTTQSQPVADTSASDLGQITKAAQSGDLKAQVQLANRLYDGKDGVTTDHVEAYKWATVAASKGDHDGTALQHEFDRFMSRDEVTAGKAAAAAFLKEKGP